MTFIKTGERISNFLQFAVAVPFGAAGLVLAIRVAVLLT